jgi:TRAP-type C4-dicarboxylate transport system permease small subunit
VSILSVAGIRHTIFVTFETIATITFVIMLASSLLQVFFRYALNAPLMWTEELARLMCVLTTYFGSVGVLSAREHIRVDMIDGLLGRRGRDAMSILIDLLIAWFMVAFAIGCWLMTKATWNTFTASMDWFRMAYIYIAVGVAAATMAVVPVLDLYTRLCALAGRPVEAGSFGDGR